MVAFLKKFKLTVGAAGAAKTYYFLQNPTAYGGSVDTITGVTAAADEEQDEPEVSVGALLRTGKAFRINIRYTGGARGFRTAKILVGRDKLGTALDQLVGKSFRGGEITKASIPQKVQFF